MCVCCGDSAPYGAKTGERKILSEPDTAFHTCLCRACYSDFITSCSALCDICGRAYGYCECVPDALRLSGINRAYSCFCYDKKKRGAAERFIYALKGANNRDAVNFAARLLAGRIETVLNLSGSQNNSPQDYIISYTPRRKQAVRNYGADHMKLTAKLTAKMTGARFAVLFSSSAASAQKDKNAAERIIAANNDYKLVRGADDLISNAKIILIDDIITSGATMSACASLLYAAGASEVSVFSLAKAKSAYPLKH